MSTAIGVSLPRLATAVGKAVSEYAVLGKTPGFTADFIKNKYPSYSSFASAITHSRSGNAVMTDGYGPELVTNGTFDSDSDWDEVTTGFWSIADGAATMSRTTTYAPLYQDLSISVGTIYSISFTVSNFSGTSMKVGFTTDNGMDEFGEITGGGVYTFEAVPTNANRLGIGFARKIDAGCTIDSVSVREMPVLKWAPHNLALYSEQFDNAVWAKVRTTVTANQTTAPDGTTTADKIIETAETGNHFIVDSSSVSFSVGQIGTSAVFLKAGERSAAVMQITDPSSPSRTRLQAIVDLSAGTITTQEFNSPTNIKSSITDAGNGWYLVKLSMATKAAGPMECLFGPLDSTSYTTNLPAYTGDGSSGIYAWGAHIFRSDLGGMADNPDRGDSYVPTAGRPVGANLVLNGTFDTDSDWTKGTGWTISGGKANHAAGTASQLTSTNSSLLNGEVYEVRFTVSNRTAGSLLLEGAIWTSAETISANGDYVFYKVKSGDGPAIFYGSGTFDGSIDDITVRKSTVNPAIAAYLPRIGHHVYNGSAWVNEGLLAESEARTNLLGYSNDFTNAAWITIRAATPTLNAIGPDGKSTSAATITDDNSGGTGTVYLSEAVAVGTQETYTFSVYAKKDQINGIMLYHTNFTTPANNGWIFNLEDGTFSAYSGSPASTATIENAGNGWYRCAITFTTDASDTAGNVRMYLASGTNIIVDLDSTSSILIYGAQFEQGSTPSSFIPTDTGASVTRAAETFTIPSANLPWPSPNYIGSELVTNGTFDTDTSGWTGNFAGVTLSVDNQRLKIAVSGASSGYAFQEVPTVAGKVYSLKVDKTDGTNTAWGVLVEATIWLQGPSSTDADGSYEYYFVASDSSTNLRVYGYGDGTHVFYDNISVREINPLSVSIAMDGRMTYADLNENVAGYFYQWREDSNNRVVQTLVTNSGTGAVSFQQVEGGIFDAKTTGGSLLSPDVLVPYNTAGRHGSTFVNGAVDGVALTADTTPTALADLSATDLNLAYDYMGTVGTFRVWDKDLGDDGIVEATNPSLEPSLSLTFEGTGTNSFVVNDWSE